MTAFAAAGLAACSRAAPPAPAVGFVDDFTAVPDGPLDGRIAPGGLRWRSGGADNDAAPVIHRGAVGPPPGHIPGAPSPGGDQNPAAAAGYASVQLPAVVSRVGAEYRWDPSAVHTTGLTVGTADFPPGHVTTSPPGVDAHGSPDIPARRGGSSAHLAITPLGVQFAVFSRGVAGDFTPLVPDGWWTPIAFFPTAQACDGRSVYRAEITIDRPAATAQVRIPGLAPLTFRDPRIGTVAATWPFWEYYSTPGGTNLPRFTKVWAG